MNDISSSANLPHILVADDQAHILETLTIFLEGENFSVVTTDDANSILSLIKHHSFDMVLLDMNYTQDTTSGKEGLSLLDDIRKLDENLPVILMTAWASVELSVNAMRNGASDFIEKPWENRRLLSILRNQLTFAKEHKSNQRLRALTRESESVKSLIAESAVMQPVLDLIDRTALSDANILLTGESGVGKSMIAKAIHNLSSRSERPMVSVNMGALADSVFESELFGHTKGAYTDAKSNRIGRFEMADNGTLFLDEIANIPKALQGKLLRVLESGEFEALGSSKTQQVNVRIVSASNVDFDKEIESGNFRSDLFYRLNTINIHIPPLRERGLDIILLAEKFLTRYMLKYRKNNLELGEEAKQALLKHSWPGNVRELEHTIERSVLMCMKDTISQADLGLINISSSALIDNMTLEQAEEYLINRAMTLNDGNVAQAADDLGLSRPSLYRRLEKINNKHLKN